MTRTGQSDPTDQSLPLVPVPPVTGIANVLRDRWTEVLADPDQAVRPTTFTTAAPPARRVDITPGGFAALAGAAQADRVGTPPSPASGYPLQLHTAAAPPSTTDRLISVGLLNSLNSRGPSTTRQFLDELELAPWAVWTLLEVEHPTGRRWDPARRLGRRRCTSGHWSIDLDVLNTTARSGWLARSADRFPVRVRGAVYDVIVADVWRAPSPADGLLPHANWVAPT